MKRCRVKRPNFQIKNKVNKENKTSDKHEHGNDFIADVSGSVTYQGVTYNWGDKVVSPNGYEFFVVTDDGRWGLVDHGGTFCELQHCDLTGYLHCHQQITQKSWKQKKLKKCGEKITFSFTKKMAL